MFRTLRPSSGAAAMSPRAEIHVSGSLSAYSCRGGRHVIRPVKAAQSRMPAYAFGCSIASSTRRASLAALTCSTTMRRLPLTSFSAQRRKFAVA